MFEVNLGVKIKMDVGIFIIGFLWVIAGFLIFVLSSYDVFLRSVTFGADYYTESYNAARMTFIILDEIREILRHVVLIVFILIGFKGMYKSFKKV